ncbi:hypothetical protein P4571_15380 [Niallia alba]|uniref:hypothetical protein n=1 Tax=Niallia alba TaxID=2729105 RepID=UPI002E1BBC27|nr:hypothetical protein [Niallia alba]
MSKSDYEKARNYVKYLNSIGGKKYGRMYKSSLSKQEQYKEILKQKFKEDKEKLTTLSAKLEDTISYQSKVVITWNSIYFTILSAVITAFVVINEIKILSSVLIILVMSLMLFLLLISRNHLGSIYIYKRLIDDAINDFDKEKNELIAEKKAKEKKEIEKQRIQENLRKSLF